MWPQTRRPEEHQVRAAAGPDRNRVRHNGAGAVGHGYLLQALRPTGCDLNNIGSGQPRAVQGQDRRSDRRDLDVVGCLGEVPFVTMTCAVPGAADAGTRNTI